MSRTFLGSAIPYQLQRNVAKILAPRGTQNNKENKSSQSKAKEEQKDKLIEEDDGNANFDDSVTNIFSHAFTTTNFTTGKRKCTTTPSDCGTLKKVHIFEPKDTLAEPKAKDSKDKTPKKTLEKVEKDKVLVKKTEASPQNQAITSINPLPAPTTTTTVVTEPKSTPPPNSKPKTERKTRNKVPKNDSEMIMEITTKKDNNPAPAEPAGDVPENQEADEKKENKKGSKTAKPRKTKTESKNAVAKTKNEKEKKEGDDLNKNKPSKFGTSKRVFKKSTTENYVRYNPKNHFKDRFRGDKKTLMTKYRPNGKFKFGKKFYQKNKELIQGGGELEEQELREADLKAKENQGLTDQQIREKILLSRIQGSKFLSRGLAESLETQVYPEVELEKDPLEMTESDHLKMLKEHFGYSSFKPCQLESIQRVLRGLSTLVILNTGSGKSLIYQYSSLLMKNLTIVISPLISLTVDQLQKLPKSIRGASLNGSLTAEEKKKVLSLVHEGKVKVLYLSPEYVSHESFDNFPAINFVCVDEVHCMSEWSHNFRTSYFFLKSNLKKKLGEPPFLGLTATATKDTQASISSLLGLSKDCVIWNTTQNKDLVLSISRDRDVFKGLINLLRSPKYSNLTSIIVYCNMKRTVEAMAQFLNSNGIKAAAYHADKGDSQRIKIQEDFMNNKYRVIVATIAFGMGIDKQDVQAVIHVSLPHTLENYVQEIGRAGRNGNTAYCHLFLSDDDYFKTRNMLYGEFVEENVIKLLVNKLLAQRQVQGENEEEPIKNPLFSIKVSELLEQFDLKLETITTIIARIGQCENNFFKLIGIGKLKCVVGFYKSDPEVLKTKSMFVFNLIENARKFRGNYTVNLCKLANKMNYGIEDCLNELRTLVKAGEISYQLEDEGFIYQLNYIPKPEELHEIIGAIYQKIRAIENMSVLKIDTIYYVMRILAQPSVDFMVKNKDLESKKNVDIKIKDQEEMFELEIEAKNESDFMVQGSLKIQRLVGKYFEADDIASLEDYLGEEQKKNEVLPLYFITEEDRSSIISDVIMFIRGQPDIYFSSDNSQRDINGLSSKKVLKILQGVNSKHTPISEWKNSPFWGKYNQFDSQALDACIKDAVLIHLLEKSKIQDKETPVVEEEKEGADSDEKRDNEGEMELETENVGNIPEAENEFE